ncbi:putative DCC family thiol-disulfide oxidoreductase YuxK [Arthrobacter sp. CAN_A212]|uniref:thiol-disulfide oxidoreductase DCC family protein n=1 Tax=Arthrobacter sp. CAN_A212 TaxID=2787719 RepID=UPI0018CB3CDD
MQTHQAIFLFDGDCGFCAKAVAWLKERADPAVRFSSWQQFDLASVGLTELDTESQAILVTGGKGKFEGHLAFGEVLRGSSKRDVRLLGRLILEQPSREIARWIYLWVAKNRYRLSEGGQSCSASK